MSTAASAVTTPDGNVLVSRFDANGQLWQQVKKLRRADGGFDERVVFTRAFDAAATRAERLARAAGVTVRAGTMRDTDQDLRTSLLVRADGPVQTVADLRGRPVWEIEKWSDRS